MLLTFDIETLPCSDPAIIAELAAKIKPPGNISKPETIAKWLEDNKEQALADAIHKTGLDGLYGRICCIGYAFDDGDVFTSSGDDEKSVLEHFYSHVFDVARYAIVREGDLPRADQWRDHPVTVVGHNVVGFDLPFLKHRSIINRVKPINVISKAMAAKPWDDCVADTMLMWDSDHREKRASMDKLCRAFGIDGKGDFDGSMVAATWPNDPQKVIDYCKDDVRRTREIYKRLTFQESAK